MSDTPEARDLLAAQYVLGCLGREDARTVEALAVRDATFAAAIAAWQERLAPLAALVPPVSPPPEIWDRLSGAIAAAGPQPAASPPPIVRAWRSVAVWRATTAGALALAAAIAGVAIVHRPAPSRSAPPMYVAELAPMNGPKGLMAEMHPDGALLVRPMAPMPHPAGKDFELWALAPGAKRPVSLGVMPPEGVRVAAAGMARPDTQLMVSLEPQGGSPTGQPTGPVMYAGTLGPME